MQEQAKDNLREIINLAEATLCLSSRIKRRNELLQNIAAGLNKLTKSAATRSGRSVAIESLEVVFIDGDDEFEFSLPQALDHLANDIYWDERGDWSDAATAEVRVL